MKDHPDILVPALSARDRVGVFGKTGSGKGWLVKSRLLNAHPRVAVWDPKDEYRAGHPDCPPDVRQLDRHDVASFAALVADDPPAETGELAVAVNDWPRDSRLRTERFHEFVGVVEDCRDLLIIIEEVGMLPREAWPDIEYIACLSRGWGAPAVFVSQRATQIPRTAREQLSRIVSFRQNRLDDAAALVELCGARAAQIPQLGQFAYVYWHDDLPNSRPNKNKEE